MFPARQEDFMNPSPRPPKTPSKLSDSLHHQINMYALVASAAGVGALASTQPSEAKIVYTPAHHVIGENQKYTLAFDHKTADFVIANSQCVTCSSSGWKQLAVAPASNGHGESNQVIGAYGWASALRRGARISDGRAFYPGGVMAEELWPFGASKTYTEGPWANVSNRYLGLRFEINGKFHYGWARLNVTLAKGDFEITATLTGYAYETIPGKPIIAGKTKGESNSLGALAAGAAGRPGK